MQKKYSLIDHPGENKLIGEVLNWPVAEQVDNHLLSDPLLEKSCFNHRRSLELL